MPCFDLPLSYDEISITEMRGFIGGMPTKPDIPRFREAYIAWNAFSFSMFLLSIPLMIISPELVKELSRWAFGK